MNLQEAFEKWIYDYDHDIEASRNSKLTKAEIMELLKQIVNPETLKNFHPLSKSYDVDREVFHYGQRLLEGLGPHPKWKYLWIIFDAGYYPINNGEWELMPFE
jgi:hypothetical protein